jgi:hypothetical protein
MVVSGAGGITTLYWVAQETNSELFPGLPKVTLLSRRANAGDDRLRVMSRDDVADIPSQKSDDHHAPASSHRCRDSPFGRNRLERDFFFAPIAPIALADSAEEHGRPSEIIRIHLWLRGRHRARRLGARHRGRLVFPRTVVLRSAGAARGAGCLRSSAVASFGDMPTFPAQNLRSSSAASGPCCSTSMAPGIGRSWSCIGCMVRS